MFVLNLDIYYVHLQVGQNVTDSQFQNQEGLIPPPPPKSQDDVHAVNKNIGAYNVEKSSILAL